MKVINDLNILDILEIIERNAKYQKVMLLYDDSVSNSSIIEIYQSIRNICIFNKMDMRSIDTEEINNGYKLIIYLCSADSFLSCNFDRAEYVNIIIPTDQYLLAYLMYYNKIDNKLNDYLLLRSKVVDNNILTSVCFNRFYNLVNSLLFLEDNYGYDEALNPFLSTSERVEELFNISETLEFVDVDIIRSAKIEYKYLGIIDVVLIDAFLMIINSVKTNTLSLVDVYKSTKDNHGLIDKFYAMVNNEILKNVIRLNYDQIVKCCTRMRELIITNLNHDLIEKEKLQEIMSKLKDYTKNTDNIMSYLYLYDLFGV